MNIPFFKNYSDEKEVQYVKDVLLRGMYWANGPEIKQFEKIISEYIGCKYCITFNSGTSALHAILIAYDIKNSEVIVPSFTFIATANTVLLANGKPTFADIEEETFGINPESVKEKISPKTRAIIPIHYGGCACKIREIKEIAEDHDLLLIEDAAESLGAKIGDQMIGNFGNAAMFSFTPTKIVSTGEGGVIVTDSKEIYEKLLLIRSHGRLETEDYFSSIKYMDYIMLGYNFRMPTICAAVGLAQMEKIQQIINLRRKIAKFYDLNLKKLNKNVRIPIVPSKYHHIYQMYSILITDGMETRNNLQNFLYEQGISSKIYFNPIHKTHFYKNELGYSPELKITEDISSKILSIPIYPTLTGEEQRFIVDKISEFFKSI